MDIIAKTADHNMDRRAKAPKGARLHNWAYCELADLDTAEYDEDRSGLWTPNLWTRGLLIRRNISLKNFMGAVALAAAVIWWL